MSYDNPDTVLYDDGTWIDMTSSLTNNWVKHSNSAYGAARICRINGIVYVNFMIDSGTSGIVTSTPFPAGYRPADQLIFRGITYGGSTRFDVTASGIILNVVNYNATWTSLNCSYVAAP